MQTRANAIKYKFSESLCKLA